MAYEHSGVDLANRILINQDRALRVSTGVPADEVPIFVTGGIPIQRYLAQLLERMPNLPAENLVALDMDVTPPISGSRSTLHSDPDLDNSSLYRQLFLDEYMRWTARHVRVKVNIDGIDQPCYVWQSILEEPSLESESGDENDESDEIDVLERNVHEEPAAAPEPAAQAAVMFRRYDLFSLNVLCAKHNYFKLFLACLCGWGLSILPPCLSVLVNSPITCVNWSR